MTTLMKAGEIHKRPVVTLDGEDIAQVKDIVYTGAAGVIQGFTLNGRGLLSGPLKEGLAWSHLLALGPDALIIESPESLEPMAQLTEKAEPSGGDVLNSRMLTDAGEDLGKVVDVIIEVADSPGERASVVGYEIESNDDNSRHGKRFLIPLPDTVAASGEHLVVPASAKEFVGDDLTGFGAAVAEFRRRLSGGEL